MKWVWTLGIIGGDNRGQLPIVRKERKTNGNFCYYLLPIGRPKKNEKDGEICPK